MNVSIHPLTCDDLEPAFALATDVFAHTSTLHRALGITLPAYRAYLRPAFKPMVSEGLSICARNDAGDLIGCLMATDFAHQFADTPPPPAPFEPLAALTQSLSAQYGDPVQQGQTILIDMATVDPAASGQGIYQKMRKSAHDLARAKGYSTVVGELSSKATQHVVLDRMGHTEVARVTFADFTFQGTRPFTQIKNPPALILAKGIL